MRGIFLFITLGLFTLKSTAQCLATFQDINNFVYIFDSGESKYIENLPLRSFKIGRNNTMAYVGQNGRLKVYYKGKVYPVNDNTPAYYMTDNWMLYQNFNLIKVLYGNEFKAIENFFRQDQDSLYYSDSIIAWTNVMNELNVFYDGQTQLLERTEIHDAKISDNIFAYMDRNNAFKVFYHGQLQTLETYEPRSFAVDRDMLAYVDWYGNMKFFYDGILTETTLPAPTMSITVTPANLFPGADVTLYSNYATGEGFAVYLTQLKELTVFYKGEETILMSDRPAFITIKENLIVYADHGNNFWAWYKGKKYWLERYIPAECKVDNDIAVYKDINGRLKAFYYGEQVEVSDQIVDKYNLYNEAVTYSIQPYQTKIWCNKKTFTFE
jgi:hypothetical protein